MTAKRFYGKGIPRVDLDQLKGKLIVIEGADGSGRSTQIEMLQDWLERLGYATEEVGLKRSDLVGKDLDRITQGNTVTHVTLSLFYATDFVDQLERKILPALRSGFIVLADRYIYSLMARAIARGANPDWIREVYGTAIVPDVVFFLKTNPKVLAERTFQEKGMLTYWESGMDILGSGNVYECFIKYQRQIQKVFKSLHQTYHFETLNGNKAPWLVSKEIQRKLEPMLLAHKDQPKQN